MRWPWRRRAEREQAHRRPVCVIDTQAMRREAAELARMERAHQRQPTDFGAQDIYAHPDLGTSEMYPLGREERR